MSSFSTTSTSMEPTGPIPSRGTPATQLLDALTTVQPLMWSLELERANHRISTPSGIGVRSPYRSVWREISERSRQRGTQALTGKEWPGAVFLPAWIVHRLMDKKVLAAPASWNPLDSVSASKLIGLLGGWQQDRSLYEFSVLPSKIIRHAEVNVVLSLKTFASIPSYAVYIDLESVRDPIGETIPDLSDDVPSGFLVGLNIHKDVPELVMASLRSGQILVECLPLDGSTLDSSMARTAANPGPGKNGRLSIMISALLMICYHRAKVEQVHDGASEYGVLKVWNRWRVSDSFNEKIHAAYKDAKLHHRGLEPCIVAHWSHDLPANPHSASLYCSVGVSIDWKRFSLTRRKVTADLEEKDASKALVPEPAPAPDLQKAEMHAGSAPAPAPKSSRAPAKAKKADALTKPKSIAPPLDAKTKKRQPKVGSADAKKTTASKTASSIPTSPGLVPSTQRKAKAVAKTEDAGISKTLSTKPSPKGSAKGSKKADGPTGLPRAPEKPTAKGAVPSKPRPKRAG